MPDSSPWRVMEYSLYCDRKDKFKYHVIPDEKVESKVTIWLFCYLNAEDSMPGSPNTQS